MKETNGAQTYSEEDQEVASSRNVASTVESALQAVPQKRSRPMRSHSKDEPTYNPGNGTANDDCDVLSASDSERRSSKKPKIVGLLENLPHNAHWHDISRIDPIQLNGGVPSQGHNPGPNDTNPGPTVSRGNAPRMAKRPHRGQNPPLPSMRAVPEDEQLQLFGKPDAYWLNRDTNLKKEDLISRLNLYIIPRFRQEIPEKNKPKARLLYWFKQVHWDRDEGWRWTEHQFRENRGGMSGEDYESVLVQQGRLQAISSISEVTHSAVAKRPTPTPETSQKESKFTEQRRSKKIESKRSKIVNLKVPEINKAKVAKTAHNQRSYPIEHEKPERTDNITSYAPKIAHTNTVMEDLQDHHLPVKDPSFRNTKVENHLLTDSTVEITPTPDTPMKKLLAKETGLKDTSTKKLPSPTLSIPHPDLRHAPLNERDRRVVVDAIRRVLFDLTYHDLSRHPSALSYDSTPSLVAWKDEHLQRAIPAAFSPNSHFYLTFKNTATGYEHWPPHWYLSDDEQAIAYPCRGRGPVHAQNSGAFDTVIVAGILLDAGSTVRDRRMLRGVAWTDLLSSQENILIEAMSVNWNVLSPEESVSRRNRLWARFNNEERKKNEQTYKKEKAEDLNRKWQIGQFQPVVPIWEACTDQLAQFQFSYRVTTEECAHCKRIASTSAISQRSRVVLGPQYQTAEAKDSTMQEMMAGFFSYQVECECGSTKGRSVRLIGDPPLRMVVSLDPGTVAGQHTRDIKIQYETEEVSSRRRVAEYRWLGGIYLHEKHYRVYWADHHRYEPSLGYCKVYDGMCAGGGIIGDVPWPNGAEFVHPEWCQSGITILFYEQILEPSAEVLLEAESTVRRVLRDAEPLIPKTTATSVEFGDLSETQKYQSEPAMNISTRSEPATDQSYPPSLDGQSKQKGVQPVLAQTTSGQSSIAVYPKETQSVGNTHDPTVPGLPILVSTTPVKPVSIALSSTEVIPNPEPSACSNSVAATAYLTSDLLTKLPPLPSRSPQIVPDPVPAFLNEQPILPATTVPTHTILQVSNPPPTLRRVGPRTRNPLDPEKCVECDLQCVGSGVPEDTVITLSRANGNAARVHLDCFRCRRCGVGMHQSTNHDGIEVPNIEKGDISLWNGPPVEYDGEFICGTCGDFLDSLEEAAAAGARLPVPPSSGWTPINLPMTSGERDLDAETVDFGDSD